MTNVWIAIIAARSLTTAGFGEFGVAIAAYLFALAIARTWTTEPFGILLAKRDMEGRRSDVQGLCAVAVLIGLIASVVLILGSLVAGADTTDTVAVIALVLPFLFLQDALRLTMLVGGEGRSAAINDGVWLAVTVAASLMIHIGTPATAVSVWAVGGVIAAGVGLWQLNLVKLTGGLAWFRRSRTIGVRLSLETLTTLVTGQLFVLIVGVGFGLEGAGAVRGTYVLFGPLAVVFGAISIRSVPIVAGFAGEVRRVGRAVRRLSAGFAALAAVQCAAVLVIPERLGVKVLGATWSSARDIVPQYSIVWIATGLAGGPIVGLKAHGLVSRSLATRVSGSLVALLLVAYGLAVLDLGGLTWLVAASACITVAFWWTSWQTSSAMRHKKSPVGLAQDRP